MGVYEEQIVPIKISRLAEYVSQRKHISLEEALTYIYINPMYDNLYDEGAKWWYLSTEALYEEFESARKADIRVIEPEVSDFYIYTLEKYALAKGLTGLQALALMKRYGVDDFLLDHYDLLHTQGTGYMIDEIDLMIGKCYLPVFHIIERYTIVSKRFSSLSLFHLVTLHKPQCTYHTHCMKRELIICLIGLKFCDGCRSIEDSAFILLFLRRIIKSISSITYPVP